MRSTEVEACPLNIFSRPPTPFLPDPARLQSSHQFAVGTRPKLTPIAARHQTIRSRKPKRCSKSQAWTTERCTSWPPQRSHTSEARDGTKVSRSTTLCLKGSANQTSSYELETETPVHPAAAHLRPTCERKPTPCWQGPSAGRAVRPSAHQCAMRAVPSWHWHRRCSRRRRVRTQGCGREQRPCRDRRSSKCGCISATLPRAAALTTAGERARHVHDHLHARERAD
mmetsp:Transcript_42091/g.136198  ORF Transcript_42091/g.136198 Transcript_42091/m.136198 type:complete len:226 (-) Transcript_42091:86-763(-)